MATPEPNLPEASLPGGPADVTHEREIARKLAERYRCNVCHRPDFAGQENVPRIAAQREDYLLKTMREYKSNARVGYEPVMLEVMRPLTDADIADLAYTIARMK